MDFDINIEHVRGSRHRDGRQKPWTWNSAKHKQPPTLIIIIIIIIIIIYTGWLEFAGLENDGLEHDGLKNDGVEQEQTYILHPMINFNVYDM